MKENYLKETTFKEFNVDILKEAIVYNIRRLKDKAEDQRENQHILVPIELYTEEWIRKEQIINKPKALSILYIIIDYIYMG